MDDQELAAIRAARLQQLQQSNSGGVSGGDLSVGGSDPDANPAAKRAGEEQEQMRRDLLATALDNKTRERCEHCMNIRTDAADADTECSSTNSAC